MNNERGIVSEIMNKEGLTAEDIKKELKERGISEKPYHIYWITSLTVAVILWLLPTIAKYTSWRFLIFFANLPRFEFPLAVIVLGIFLLVVGISLISQASYRRRKLGGLEDVDETIVIIKEGPYKIVRNPDFLGQMFLFPSLSIVLSIWIPFTIFAIIYWALIIGMITYFISIEEKFNIKKWGEEYKRYMKEVPAINFVKGLWNIRKKMK